MLQSRMPNLSSHENTRSTTSIGNGNAYNQRSNTYNSLDSTNNRQAWIRLFQSGRSHQGVVVPSIPEPSSPYSVRSGLPIVGGNYEFIEPQTWPDQVVRIESSIFSASRPYPVLNLPEYFDEMCGCEGSCVSNTGTHLTTSCLNVNTATVCNSVNCSLGSGCGNRFQPRFPLDLVESRAGLGVVCSYRIPNGAFIVEYVGEILYADDAGDRPDRRYQARFRTEAAWNGGTSIYVDAFECGNESRFINHSCQPNCALYEYNWTNTTRLGIFAIDEIPPLQELTFRYRRHSRDLFDCQCAAHLVCRR